jgi:hypothetical protein
MRLAVRRGRSSFAVSDPPRRSRRRAGVTARAVAGALLALANLIPLAQGVRASATVTVATGGTAISADSGATGGTGAYATLSGPRFTEGAAGDIGLGTIVLGAPAGFSFDPTSGSATKSGTGCLGLAFAAPVVTTSSVTLTVTAASTAKCVLAFTGLRVRPNARTPLAAGPIVLGGTAVVAGAPAGTSVGTLTEVAGAPRLLAVARQPSGGTGGTALATQPAVAILDAAGNPAGTATTSVTLAITAGSGTSGATLACTGGQTKAAVAGTATFAGCRIDKAGAGYTLGASATGLTGATSAALSIAVGPAAKLAFATQPGGGTAGSAWAVQPVVAVQDAGGNTVPTAVDPVSLAIAAGTGAGGATLTCTGGLSRPAVAGIATFSGCAIDRASATTKLAATAAGLTGITSSALPVVAGPASAVSFSAQPAGGTGGAAMTPQPVAKIVDAFGNVVSSSAAVTLAIVPGTGTAGAILSCTGGLAKAASAGTATFSGCAIDRTGSGYQLTASAAGLIAATGSPFAITAGVGKRLQISIQPSGGTGGTALPTQPVVAILDAGGNPTTSTATVSLALTTGTGTSGAVLTCTNGNTRTAVGGVATFSGCAIDKAASGYTLTATASGMTSAATNALTIAVGPATRLGFTTSPTAAVAGAAFPSQPALAIQDAGGNTVSGASGGAVLSVGPGTGGTGATLTCSAGTTLAFVAGLASAAGCSLDVAATGYGLMATGTGAAAGLASATGGVFTVAAGPAAALVVGQQPSGGTGGLAWPTQPSVRVVDALGNTVSSGTVSIGLAITAGTGTAGSILACSGGTTKGTSAGVAAFSGCAINGAGSGYTLTASATGLTGATTAAFSIGVGAAASLAFTTSPTGGTGGAPFAVQPVVVVRDAGGNPITTSTASVTLAIAAGSGAAGSTITCTGGAASQAIAGVASFAGCAVDKVSSTVRLTASSPGLTSATSTTFAITLGPAAKLGFATQPGGGTAGASWAAQPVVVIQDAGGNTVTSATDAVTIAIAAGTGTAGATIACTTSSLTKSAIAGAAAFAGCAIPLAGAGYRLTASASGLVAGVSNAFTIAPGSATRLTISVEPAGATGGTAFATQPVVRITDALGNTAASSASVTLAITSGTGTPGAVLACTGGQAKAASAGTATFAGCRVDLAGTAYTLRATATGLTSATTASFDVAVGAPARLAIGSQPSGGTGGLAWSSQPVIVVQDAGGNLVSSATTTVALAIAPATGAAGAQLTCAGGATLAAVAGTASFAGCAIDRAGAGYRLIASATGLTGVTTSTFGVAVGPAARLAFVTGPPGSVAGTIWSTPPVVSIVDAGGNVVVGATDTVALAVTAGSGGATGAGAVLGCGGGTSLAAVAGLATFAGCSMTRASTGYTVTASAAGLAPAVSAVFSIAAGPAASLNVTRSPGGGSGGATWAIQPVVAITDAYGNPVATPTTVTLAITAGTGSAGATLACSGGLAIPTSGGIATFSGCRIDQTGLGYTLSASAPGLSTDDTAGFDVATGPPFSLAFTAQPSGGTAGAPWTGQPAVTVLDAGGNVVDTSTDLVTLAVATNPGGGGLTCTSVAVVPTAGVASFAGCAIDRAGLGYTLRATAPGLVAATSASLSIGPGAATGLRFATSPTTASGGSAFVGQPIVVVVDANDNVVTASSAVVTLAIGRDPGDGSLACNGGLATAAVGGTASFASCSIDRAGTGYTLVASAPGLTGATSSPFSVVVGPAASLVFQAAPDSATGGSPFPIQPIVRVVDAGGNLVTASAASVALTIAAGSGTPGATLSCSGGGSATAGAGIATFGGCRIDRSASGYILRASSSGLTVSTSTAFDVSVGPSAVLVVASQPSGGTAGVAWAGQPAIAITDAGGNAVGGATDTITLTAGSGPSGGTFDCTGGATLAAVAGIATFTGCSSATAGSGSTLVASAPGLTSVTTGGYTIVPAAAAGLALVHAPSGGGGGLAWATQPQVAIVDGFANTVTSSSAVATLAIVANPGGGTLTCNGGPARTATAGLASFVGCRIDRAGVGYTLVATSPGLTSATTGSFDIGVGPASQLAFTIEPSGGTGGLAWSSQPVVRIEDAGGNLVTGSSATVTYAVGVGTGTAGATLSCVSSRTVAAVAGLAWADGCAIDRAGTGYRLVATSAGLGPITSASFDVVAGPSAALRFATQPGAGTAGVAFPSQPVVAIVDAGGNAVPGATDAVTIGLVAGPGGTLDCTAGQTQIAVGGAASFSGCVLDVSGSGYVLQAVAPGLIPATGAAFAVAAGPAASLAFGAQPSGGSGGLAWSTQPSVTVRDAFGNLVNGSTVAVTLAIGADAGGGTLACSGGATRSSASGTATFAGCRIDRIGSGYSLTASGTGLTAATSAAFDILLGPATALAFATDTSGGTADTEWSIQPVVQVVDAGGNLVPTATGTVSLAISAGSGTGGATLDCGTAETAAISAGQAAFGDCTIARSGTGYRLRATAAGLASAVGAPFDVAPGTATALAFAGAPSGSAGGAVFGTTPVVVVHDAHGNTVTGSTVDVSLALATDPTGGASLSCPGSTITTTAGSATFSGCSIDRAASGYVLQASAGGLSSATSAPFDVAIGPAARLVVVASPGGASGGSTFTTQPVVDIVDLGGNRTSSSASVILALAAGTGTAGATLTCASSLVTAAVAGRATFGGCRIDRAGSAYELTAASAGLGTDRTDAFDVAIGPAASLAFTAAPGGGTAGTAWAGQPVVEIRDAGGNPISGAAGTVSLAISTGSGASGATLACAGGTDAVAVAGSATFAGCTVDLANTTYRLTATSAGLAATTSAPFSITPAAPVSLGFVVQPGGGTGGIAWSIQPAVRAFDAFGNPTTDPIGVTVGIAVGTGSSAAALACTGGPTRSTSATAAVFGGCAIDAAAAGYRLVASAEGLSSVTSAAFTVTAGPAARLAFAVEPGDAVGDATWSIAPTVQAWDAGGNLATGVSLAVTIGLTPGSGSGGATLSCSPSAVRTTTAGVAVFGACSVDRSGSGYTLTASAPGVVSVVSAPFEVRPPAASISVSPASRAIVAGGTAAISVSIAARGAARAIALQASSDGATWTTLATATTDAYGATAFTVAPTVRTRYRAVFTGAADLAPGESGTATVTVAQTATLSPTPGGSFRSIRHLTTVAFTVRARPNPAIKTLVTFQVYRRSAGLWKLYATRRIWSDVGGTARLSWRFGTRGDWEVRARAEATTANSASAWTRFDRYHVL